MNQGGIKNMSSSIIELTCGAVWFDSDQIYGPCEVQKTEILLRNGENGEIWPFLA